MTSIFSEKEEARSSTEFMGKGRWQGWRLEERAECLKKGL